jgi:DNA-binding transcriptional LysR family regulator
MEIREIRLFLVLAEELHFGRTAERLNLSQTRVSQTVRALEGQLGGRLFERTSRRVRLTRLGERLRDRLRPVYEELNRVVDEVRETRDTVTGELRLALYSQLVGGPRIAEVIRRYEERHRESRVTIKDPPIAVGLEGLRRGELDLMASWLPLDEPDMRIGPILACEDRVLAVCDTHPLAERGYATVEDLADHSVIDRPGLPEVTRDALVPRTSPSGRPIERRYRADTAMDFLTLVARGAAIHPTVASSAAYMAFPGVTYVPLRGLPPMRSALVWRIAAESAAIRAFAVAAREVEQAATVH